MCVCLLQGGKRGVWENWILYSTHVQVQTNKYAKKKTGKTQVQPPSEYPHTTPLSYSTWAQNIGVCTQTTPLWNPLSKHTCITGRHLTLWLAFQPETRGALREISCWKQNADPEKAAHGLRSVGGKTDQLGKGKAQKLPPSWECTVENESSSSIFQVKQSHFFPQGKGGTLPASPRQWRHRQTAMDP